jgi:hypothetical protein
VAQLQSEITTLKSSVAALQRQVTLIAQNRALELGPFVSINPNPVNGIRGPLLVISGVNVMIQNGMGSTDNTNGLGNLCLGYSEATKLGTTPTGWTIGPIDRMGSHNIVLGLYNKWTNLAFGGIVAGEINEINAEGSSVLSGEQNQASGGDSIVVGGNGNVAAYGTSAVVSGFGNHANTQFSVIVSGQGNTANGDSSVILGGNNGTTTVAYQVLQ